MNQSSLAFRAVFHREFLHQISSVASIAVVVLFALLSCFMTFGNGDFYARNEADLDVFFSLHGWLYILIIPPVAVRLWTDEWRMGTSELLLTLPVSPLVLVLAKFAAAWALMALMLVTTLPVWIGVSVLGDPDHGVIALSYVASWLLSGIYLATGSAVSAFATNVPLTLMGTAVACLFLQLGSFDALVRLLHDYAQPMAAFFIQSLTPHWQLSPVFQGILPLSAPLYVTLAIGLGLHLTHYGITRRGSVQ